MSLVLVVVAKSTKSVAGNNLNNSYLKVQNKIKSGEECIKLHSFFVEKRCKSINQVGQSKCH